MITITNNDQYPIHNFSAKEIEAEVNRLMAKYSDRILEIRNEFIELEEAKLLS